MDHRDAEPSRGQRARRANRPPVQMDFTPIRDINTGENFAEGAFTRPVLSDQRVTTAALDLKTNSIQRQDARETLGYAVE